MRTADAKGLRRGWHPMWERDEAASRVGEGLAHEAKRTGGYLLALGEFYCV